jgi:hypothetical protein
MTTALTMMRSNIRASADSLDPLMVQEENQAAGIRLITWCSTRFGEEASAGRRDR